MAGRTATKARVSTQAQTPAVGDQPTQRALDVLTSAVQDMQAQPKRDRLEADLVVGTNRIQHGLGRPYFGYTLVATVANATFAHAHDTTNPRPELEVWITVIGVAQPRARIEVF